MTSEAIPLDDARAGPFVLDIGEYKSLYFTLDQLQSRMNTRHPTRLEVDYTRTMMGFLLLNHAPEKLAMIGLGGGSLLKFCYRHLAHTHLTVVEINPEVIALRQQFLIPEDDTRICIVCADGADFLATTPTRFDVVLVDGFDREGQAASLCSQRFYADCFKALSPQGVMLANLHHDHPQHALFTARIGSAFGQNVFEVASKEKTNSVIFACKGAPMTLESWRSAAPLKHFAPELRAQLRQEFARITWVMTQPGLLSPRET